MNPVEQAVATIVTALLRFSAEDFEAVAAEHAVLVSNLASADPVLPFARNAARTVAVVAVMRRQIEEIAQGVEPVVVHYVEPVVTDAGSLPQSE